MVNGKNKKQFIFVNDTSRLNVIFEDLRYDERVMLLDGQYKIISNKFLLLVRRIHTSWFINKYISLPFKSIWSYSLKSIDWQNDVDYYVIFDNTSIDAVPIKYLNELKQKYSIKYIIIFNDPLCSEYAKKGIWYISNMRFDYIFTLDNDDAKKEGLYFSDALCSKMPGQNSTNLQYDFYFAGIDKGRIDVLHSIYDESTNNSVTSIFRIVHVKTRDKRYSGILYNKYITYKEVVKEVQKSNCILEVLQPGQSGATLRYYEAVCYNKKLLTNNKNVLNLPFYNPDYIHVFENPEDIDWNWVKERIPVDYHYDGRFSPKKLIDRIIELENQDPKNGENICKE